MVFIPCSDTPENNWTMEAGMSAIIKRIRELQEKYSDRIEVLCGLEIDYLPGVSGPSSAVFADAGLDYSIGAVHLFYDRNSSRYYAVDNTVEEFLHIRDEIFDRDIRSFVKSYFSRISDISKSTSPQ